MKRSNRLVLLVGVFLAIVAFVGILLLVRSPGGGQRDAHAARPTGPSSSPRRHPAVDPDPGRSGHDHHRPDRDHPGRLHRPSQVIGQIVRQPIATAPRSPRRPSSAARPARITNIDCPAGLRCIAVQVDQVSGVGTVIKTGDYVDVIIGLTEEHSREIR